MTGAYEKQEALTAYLKELGKVAVAFSGGVDSTYLLKVAHDTLGDACLAITAVSEVNPGWEVEEADAFCLAEGIRQVKVYPKELEEEAFFTNPKDRCYHCKKIVFGLIQEAALERGIPFVAEGSNMDDTGDYRPGLIAVKECGILSPLRKVELYKEEIRFLSEALHLPTWQKPSFACLASRIPYGERITAEKLKQVDLAETRLKELGFRNFRVRSHEGGIARIEVAPEDFPRLTDPAVAASLNDYFRDIGFTFVTLDLGGYRTGSLNEALGTEELEAQKARQTDAMNT